MKTIKTLFVTACIAGAVSLAQAQTAGGAASPSTGGNGTGAGLNNGMVDGANKGGTGADPVKTPKHGKRASSKSASSGSMGSDGKAGEKTTDGSTVTPSGAATTK